MQESDLLISANKILIIIFLSLLADITLPFIINPKYFLEAVGLGVIGRRENTDDILASGESRGTDALTMLILVFAVISILLSGTFNANKLSQTIFTLSLSMILLFFSYVLGSEMLLSRRLWGHLQESVLSHGYLLLLAGIVFLYDAKVPSWPWEFEVLGTNIGFPVLSLALFLFILLGIKGAFKDSSRAHRHWWVMITEEQKDENSEIPWWINKADGLNQWLSRRSFMDDEFGSGFDLSNLNQIKCPQCGIVGIRRFIIFNMVAGINLATSLKCYGCGFFGPLKWFLPEHSCLLTYNGGDEN